MIPLIILHQQNETRGVFFIFNHDLPTQSDSDLVKNQSISKMNEPTKYLFFLKSAFSNELRKAGHDKSTGIHHPMTMREYLDFSFKHLLKVMPETFVPVKASDFIKDYALGPMESIYIKQLGWDYAKAASIVSERGAVLMYTCHISHPWRYIALDDDIKDDEIAFRVIREIEDGLGLETVFEIF